MEPERDFLGTVDLLSTMVEETGPGFVVRDVHCLSGQKFRFPIAPTAIWVRRCDVRAFREISRVSKSSSFVMNDAWKDKSGKEAMMKWNLTALTYMSCEQWLDLFKEVHYEGDYYWFFAE